MANKHKAAKPGGELIRNAKEISKVEQYWHLAGQHRVYRRKIIITSRNWLIYSSS